MSACIHDEIYDRVVVWICERSGLPREIVERVLSYERQFWEEHPRLFERALEDGDPGCDA